MASILLHHVIELQGLLRSRRWAQGPAAHEPHRAESTTNRVVALELQGNFLVYLESDYPSQGQWTRPAEKPGLPLLQSPQHWKGLLLLPCPLPRLHQHLYPVAPRRDCESFRNLLERISVRHERPHFNSTALH
jgi:hypothetical protein